MRSATLCPCLWILLYSSEAADPVVACSLSHELSALYEAILLSFFYMFQSMISMIRSLTMSGPTSGELHFVLMS